MDLSLHEHFDSETPLNLNNGSYKNRAMHQSSSHFDDNLVQGLVFDSFDFPC